MHNLSGYVCVLAEYDHSVLTKGTSAEIEITLRGDSISGTGAVPRPIPIESFAVNKDMGRILLRRGGETIAAGRFFCKSLLNGHAHIRQGSLWKFISEIRNRENRF